MKKRLSIPLLIGASGLVYALWGTPPNIVVPAPAEDEDSLPVPDSYATAVTVRRYSPKGELLDQTDAARLRRFVAEDRTEFEAPTRRGHDGDDGWTASAHSGEYSEGRTQLRLTGDVSLRYASRSLEFLTQTMHIDLDTQTARSLTPVRAWQDDGETVADRLFVNLDREVAVLTGDVRSVYQPNE